MSLRAPGDAHLREMAPLPFILVGRLEGLRVITFTHPAHGRESLAMDAEGRRWSCAGVFSGDRFHGGCVIQRSLTVFGDEGSSLVAHTTQCMSRVSSDACLRV